MAWVTIYSVSDLNCLHKDLHWTGVINVFDNGTCINSGITTYSKEEDAPYMSVPVKIWFAIPQGISTYHTKYYKLVEGRTFPNQAVC